MLQHFFGPANEVKVATFLTAFEELDEGAKQRSDREPLTSLSITVLYGSYGFQVASVNSRAIEITVSQVP